VTVQHVGCYLCGQIAGDSRSDLIAQFLPGTPYVRRVVLDSGAFAAVPSLGPLADGHLLLCPRAHLRSAAALPEAAYAEYEAVKAALVQRLMAAYDAPVHMFEHGMAASGARTVCTVEHAHVHLVPLPDHLDPLDVTGPEWIEFDGGIESLAALTRGREYVLYAPPRGRPRFCAGVAGRFESQFMRRVIARALGSRTWDWRTLPDAESAHRTWQRCAGLQAVPLGQ